jgi:hypothetical protein
MKIEFLKNYKHLLKGNSKKDPFRLISHDIVSLKHTLAAVACIDIFSVLSMAPYSYHMQVVILL